MDGTAATRSTAGGTGSSGPVPEDTLVGREQERANLRRLWEATATRGAAVAFVQGPAGFGKTSLLRDFLTTVAPTTVLHAGGEADEHAVTFGLLAQLLPAEAALPAALDRLVCGETAGLDPLLVGAALLEYLGTAGGAGLVLAVDDIQWADPPSVRALVFALRRMRTDRVFTVLCCRDDALAGLPVGLLRLVQDVAVRITLPGLKVQDVLELARELGRGGLTPAAAGRIAGHSTGSPLYVRALLTEFTLRELEGGPDSPLAAPRRFSDLVAQRWAGCGPPARALTEAVAIVGDGATLAVLARLGGVGDPAGALEEAVGAGLLRAPVSGAGPHFDHPLTRSAVFHAIPVARRARLHEAAAALLAPTDSLAALRHRVAASARFDPALAGDVAAQAGVDAANGSWILAAERFRIAAALSEPGGEPMRRFTLRMVECAALGGEPSVIEATQRAIEGLPESALREFALGRLHALAGAWVAARDCLDTAWGLADPLADPELAARICTELARAAIMRGRGGEGAAWVGRALELRPKDEAVRNDTMALWAVATGIQGHAGDALSMMTGLPTALAHPSPEQLDQLAGRGMLRLWNAQVAQARDDLSAVVAATRGRGPAFANLFASQYLADAQYRLGDWDAAIVTAEDAAATARDLGSVWTLPMLHAVASFPHSARGAVEAAAAHVTAATQAGALVRDVPSRLWTMVAAARLALARRDFAGVITALEPMRELAGLDGVREPGMQPWQPLLASALISLGRFVPAGEVLAEAEQFATTRNHPVQQLAVHRERARLFAATGRPAESVAALAAAAAPYQAIEGRPFDRAKFDLVAGRLLRRSGRHAEAVTALRGAHTALLALRAVPWLDEAAAELSRCGAGLPEGERSVLTRLTPHEIAVARLVRQGQTNREIAAELVVSVKTVGYHLGNVYAKLGIRSRTQLATLVADDAAARDGKD